MKEPNSVIVNARLELAFFRSIHSRVVEEHQPITQNHPNHWHRKQSGEKIRKSYLTYQNHAQDYTAALLPTLVDELSAI